jgi:rubrerythrin
MELIDKQAAIDAVNEIIRMEHSLRPKIYVAKDAIKKLPSVQPTFDARDTQYNLPIGTDLISRQAAIDAIHCDITVTGRQNAELVAATIGAFADRIKALPSAQPERKKGRWKVTPVYIKCSECGESFMLIPQNYCPHCGAKMEGEQDE